MPRSRRVSHAPLKSRDGFPKTRAGKGNTQGEHRMKCPSIPSLLLRMLPCGRNLQAQLFDSSISAPESRSYVIEELNDTRLNEEFILLYVMHQRSGSSRD